jgi:hypothetical protein
LAVVQNWKIAINKDIKESRYFIPVFSSVSVAKRGYVQKEFRYALGVYEDEDKFGQLDNRSRKYVEALEKSMLKNFDIWTQIYPHTSDSSDEIVNVKNKQRLEEVARVMCEDFNKIIDFMKRKPIETDLSDHYRYIKQICQEMIS